MTLGALLESLSQAMPRNPARLLGDTSALARQVKAVAYDSRKAGPGSLFVALKGQRLDGASFAAQALKRGALAVVAETEPPPGTTSPWILVSDARTRLHSGSDRADCMFGRLKTIAQHMLKNASGRAPCGLRQLFQAACIGLR